MNDHSTDTAHVAHAAHPPVNYIRIWQILLALLVVSVAGPFIGIKVVTLITAFGIACRSFSARSRKWPTRSSGGWPPSACVPDGRPPRRGGGPSAAGRKASPPSAPPAP